MDEYLPDKFDRLCGRMAKGERESGARHGRSGS